MIQQDLAHVLQKDKSIIVRQMNGLLDEKYVDRLTNTNDKRKKNPDPDKLKELKYWNS